MLTNIKIIKYIKFQATKIKEQENKTKWQEMSSLHNVLCIQRKNQKNCLKTLRF